LWLFRARGGRTLAGSSNLRRPVVFRRTAVVAAAAFGALTLGLSGLASAQASARVGPDQAFRALVNGRPGHPAPVALRVACFGPIQPGQTGHPFAGQTVKVLLGATTAAGAGFTGASATSIGVFFGPPPPSASPGTGLLTLARYGVARAIPTSLLLPCAGTGQVTFVPLPMSPPTSRAAVVPVRFVGQP
jgi:hypothetical protein